MDNFDEQIENARLKGEYPILRFFKAKHLPEPLRGVSEKFGRLALDMANILPYESEVGAGLRKLLEAKDCFVRAMLSK